MPKPDPTTKFINDNHRKPDFIRTQVARNDAPPSRVNVPRLAITGCREPLPFSFEGLANRARTSALTNHAFFLDTCFVKKEVPESCWDALLSKTVCITPWIDFELREWREDPRINGYFHQAYQDGKSGKNPQLLFLPEQHDDEEIASVISHYVSLLCFRKDIFQTMRERIKSETGKEPSDDDVHAQVQSLVRERGMKIASKGRADREKPNFSADEDLIVRAFVFALTTGRDVTVLTRDKDLTEQFFKLQYLVDTHYRSFLLADAFAKQPLNFRRYDNPDSQLTMQGFESIELYKMPAGMAERVLPDVYQFVNIHVERISESGADLFHSMLGFSAETAMAEMLRAKGRTNGCNTDSLEGKNLHRCIHPELQDELGNCVGVVKDRFVDDEKNRWSLTDIQLALTQCERSGSIAEVEVPQSKADRDTFAQACGIANFSFPRRLFPTHSFEPLKAGIESVSLGIEMMDPWTRILISDELLAELPSRFEKALASKDCYVLPASPTGRSHQAMEPIQEGDGRKIVDYYTALLSHRKMFGLNCRNLLFRRLGREPSEGEIRKELQAYCDPSCWLRAKDYLDRPNDPGVFGDEHLVVDAIFRAVCNCRETIVLTRRRTLLDQFWTLAATLQRHYLAWAVARTNKDRLLALKLAGGEQDPAFSSKVSRIDYTAQFLRSCLPAHSLEVGVQIWCIEGNLEKQFQVYPVGFPVEPAMVEMFRCKEENQFRVADWQDERNVHLMPWLDQEGEIAATAFVARDRMLKIGSADFASDPRLSLSVGDVPAFDITLMTSMDRGIPFPWAVAERKRVERRKRGKQRPKSAKGRRK